MFLPMGRRHEITSINDGEQFSPLGKDRGTRRPDCRAQGRPPTYHEAHQPIAAEQGRPLLTAGEKIIPCGNEVFLGERFNHTVLFLQKLGRNIVASDSHYLVIPTMARGTKSDPI